MRSGEVERCGTTTPTGMVVDWFSPSVPISFFCGDAVAVDIGTIDDLLMVGESEFE